MGYATLTHPTICPVLEKPAESMNGRKEREADGPKMESIAATRKLKLLRYLPSGMAGRA